MQCCTAIFFAEACDSNRDLIEQHPDEVGPDVTAALSLRGAMRAGRPDLPEILAARAISLMELFDRVEIAGSPHVSWVTFGRGVREFESAAGEHGRGDEGFG